jgi:hypothetical protein
LVGGTVFRGTRTDYILIFPEILVLLNGKEDIIKLFVFLTLGAKFYIAIAVEVRSNSLFRFW